MIEVQADLWTYGPADARVITTNGFVKKNGQAVMGRGCAYESTKIFRTIRETLGALIQAEGNKVFFLGPDFHTADGAVILTMPVKHNWWEKADRSLIVASAHQLRRVVDDHGLNHVIVPRPGCGNGGLDWDDVKPLLEPFFDDRFIIVDYPERTA